MIMIDFESFMRLIPPDKLLELCINEFAKPEEASIGPDKRSLIIFVHAIVKFNKRFLKILFAILQVKKSIRKIEVYSKVQCE